MTQRKLLEIIRAGGGCKCSKGKPQYAIVVLEVNNSYPSSIDKTTVLSASPFYTSLISLAKKYGKWEGKIDPTDGLVIAQLINLKIMKKGTKVR
jgi:hypothetical protein